MVEGWRKDEEKKDEWMLNVLPIPLCWLQFLHVLPRLGAHGADFPRQTSPHLSDLQGVLSHNSGDNAHANHLPNK